MMELRLSRPELSPQKKELFEALIQEGMKEEGGRGKRNSGSVRSSDSVKVRK